MRFIHFQELKNMWAFEVCGQVEWPGDHVDVDVMEAFALGKAYEIFFLDGGIGVHYLNQFVLDLRQFLEFFSSEFVQGLDVAFGQDDEPTKVSGGVGVIDQPVSAFVDDRSGRDTSLSTQIQTGKTIHITSPFLTILISGRRTPDGNRRASAETTDPLETKPKAR